MAAIVKAATAGDFPGLDSLVESYALNADLEELIALRTALACVLTAHGTDGPRAETEAMAVHADILTTFHPQVNAVA